MDVQSQHRDSDQPHPAHVSRSPACRADPSAERLPRCPLAGAAVGLALLVLLVYWPTLSSEFVGLDDYQYVVDNTLVHNPSWNSLRRFFVEVRTPSTVDGYYQPLTMTSLMLDAWLSGPPALNPFLYHLTNVLLHAATAVLVMLLVRMCVGGVAVPMLAAVLFALHPMQVESVAWIAQRKTVLSTLPAVACLICYLRYRRGGRGPGVAPANSRCWLTASVALYALGGLAKPTLMLLPLALPLLDIWPQTRGTGVPPVKTQARRLCHSRAGWRLALRRVFAGLPGKLPFLVCMAAMMWGSWVSQASSAARLLAPNVSSVESLARLAGLICYNLMLYVGNIFWPLHLSPYRDLPADLSLTSPAIAASVVATLAFLAVCVLAYRRSRPLLVGGIAFLILLAPALGAVRFVETCVADRFLYLPSVFLTLPLAALLVRMETPSRRRAATLRAGFALLALLLAALTWKQQAVWHDSHALWTHIVRAAPGLPKGHAELAAADLEGGAFDSALVHARRALELSPDEAGYLHVLGRALVRTGHAADAVPVLRKAIVSRLGPVEPLAHLSLAEALLVAGDAPTARAECARAIAMGRGPSIAYMMMGDAAMQFARNYAAAAEYFALALDHEPENLALRWNYGTALQYCGRDAEALREYQQVIAVYRQRGLPTDRLDSAAAVLRDRLEGRGP
jgi:hypothetical protein